MPSQQRCQTTRSPWPWPTRHCPTASAPSSAAAGSITITHAPGWLSNQSRLRVLRREVISVMISQRMVLNKKDVRPALRQSNIGSARSQCFRHYATCAIVRECSFGSHCVYVRLISLSIALGAGNGLGYRILAEVVVAIIRVVHRQMLHQGIEHLTVDFAALKHRIEHMAAERLVVG